MPEFRGFTLRWGKPTLLVIGTVSLTALFVSFPYAFLGTAKSGTKRTDGTETLPHKRDPCVWCLTSPEAAVKYQVSADPNPRPYKINGVGQYLPFLGYTVISSLEEEEALQIKAFWDNRTFIRQYISLLPASSYHVTIFSIYTHYYEKRRRSWVPDNTPLNTFIPMTGPALDVMTRGDAACRKLGSTFSGDYSTGSLESRLSREAILAANVDIRHSPWAAPLRTRMADIFLEQDQPAVRVYHMTFGYIYKALPKDHETRQKLMIEIAEAELFFKDRYLRFRPPEVHFFHDMTCFSPFRDFMTKCYHINL